MCLGLESESVERQTDKSLCFFMTITKIQNIASLILEKTEDMKENVVSLPL